MTTPTDSRVVSIELSRTEQWVVHHVLLDSVGLARRETEPETPPECAIGILEKLESGEHAFTPVELDHMRYVCGVYTRAPDTPDRDLAVATAVADRIGDILGEDEDLPAPDPP